MIFEIGKGTLSSRSTTAHAYFDAFRFPVKSGDSSARSRIRVFTLSASQQYRIDWQLLPVGVLGVGVLMLLLGPLLVTNIPLPFELDRLFTRLFPMPLTLILFPMLFPILFTIVLPLVFIGWVIIVGVGADDCCRRRLIDFLLH